MRTVSLLILPALLGACSASMSTPMPAERSAAAEAKLDRLIAGKTAAKPITCLPSYKADQMVTIDDNTIAFKDGSRVYVNNMRGGCNHLGTGMYALVTRTSMNALCSGDIAQIADLSSGMTVGACALGEFTPYTKS